MTGTQHACSTIFCGQSGTGFLLVKLMMMVTMIEVWRFLTVFYPPWKLTWAQETPAFEDVSNHWTWGFSSDRCWNWSYPGEDTVSYGWDDYPLHWEVWPGHIYFTNRCAEKRRKVLGIILLVDGKGRKNPFCESLLRWDNFSRGSDDFGVPPFLEELIWFFYLENLMHPPLLAERRFKEVLIGGSRSTPDD